MGCDAMRCVLGWEGRHDADGNRKAPPAVSAASETWQERPSLEYEYELVF